MKKIETQRHPLKFYATIVFGFLFLFALGSFTIFIGLENEASDQSKHKHIVLPIMGSIVCLLAIWMVYSYWKNSPKIIIDKTNVKIGNETFRLNSIKDVILTGKMPFRFITNFPMEGTAILFDNGREKILFDDMYSNSYEVKSFLEQVIINKQEFKTSTIKKINKNELRFENTEKFIGNQFTSLRGISLWGLIGFFTILIIGKETSMKLGGVIFFSLLGAFWFLLHYWLMHYFELTRKFLIVRNHIFIWKMKIYDLSDIKEIV